MILLLTLALIFAIEGYMGFRRVKERRKSSASKLGKQRFKGIKTKGLQIVSKFSFSLTPQIIQYKTVR